ncbi:MAG: hypothetical protein K8T25_09070 [Planctomycetia bacterium]|nr:hypothetical protein [Planctomycetia bacterium]
MTEPIPRPQRRWLQFRMRTLLIGTAIIAAVLGWWSYKARQQREAVAALRKVSARVDYDASLLWTGGLENPPQWPQWCLDTVGMDYLAHVTGVEVVLTKVANSDLARLQNLTTLEEIRIYDAYYTAAEVAQLQRSLPGCRIIRIH